MKRRQKILLVSLGITATILVLPKIVRKLQQAYAPAGWARTVITIQNIAPQDGSYAYTLTYNYPVGEETKTIEQYILDDRKPKPNQKIAAIYCLRKPVLFELSQLIQYE